MTKAELLSVLAPFAGEIEITLSSSATVEYHVEKVFFVSPIDNEPARLTIRVGDARPDNRQKPL